MASEVPECTYSNMTRVQLEVERDRVSYEVYKMEKDLKPHASFNSEYWTQSAQIVVKSKIAVSLHTKISELDHQEQGLKGEFSQSEKAIRLREKLHALESDERLFKEQAELVSTEKDEGKSRRRAFLELFISSKIGLGITNTGRRRRDPSVQSRFRADCIDAYKSLHPDPLRESLWCPILKIWVPKHDATAAHIFAYMHGQDVMDSVFGVRKTPELFSPRNGMIISEIVEKKFDRGFMAIVPRLSDHPTLAEVQLWSSSKPRQYKVRILDLKDPDLKKYVHPNSQQTWEDLDGADVEFKSEFRPRTRYLYFHYCIQVLRRVWRTERTERTAAEQMKEEFKSVFWGTGARHDSALATPEAETFLRALGSSQVRSSGGGEGEDEDTDEDTDEDADEDEDEGRG